MQRPLVQGLAVAALCAAGPAGSVVTTTCCHTGVRDVMLRVGAASAVIDLVRFDVGGNGGVMGNSLAATANPHGNGVPVAALDGAVPIFLRVRAPNAVLPQQITVTVSSPVNLACAAGCGTATIPFSQISWTVTNPAAGDFVNGTLGGTSNILGPVTFNGAFIGPFGPFGGTYQVSNNLVFSFANTAAYAAGRYTGRVTYTVSLP
jgi:hypothetical protein